MEMFLLRKKTVSTVKKQYLYLLSIWMLTVLFSQPSVLAGTQPFPFKETGDNVSVFLIKPTEGMKKIPAGWEKVTSNSYGNCGLAKESLAWRGGNASEVAVTTSYLLPLSTYEVSICARGKGKARIKGNKDWVEFNVKPNSRYQWVELGKTGKTKILEVEISGNSGLSYGGICAEGRKLDIVPVAKVWKKIQQGKPVVVALVGDSVTENSRGTGGGSSKFETGNPGLMKAFLESKSGKSVGYISHREPPTWPVGSTWKKIRNEDPKAWPELNQIPKVEIEGKKYVDARQELDKSKTIHLLNFGKGGATSGYAYSRIFDTIIEDDYTFNKKVLKKKGLQNETVRYGLGHYKPDLVIISFGTNDNNAANPKRTVEDYLFAIKAAATNIQQRFGSAVILATPHKWNKGVHLSHHWEPLLVDRLREYCKKSGFALADIFIEYKLGQNSGIHPGNAGHAAIASAYTKTIMGIPQEPISKPEITAADLKDNGNGTVTNKKNGLMMLINPNSLGSVKNHQEALALIQKINKEKKCGYTDWRLPKRVELFPMIDQSQKPAVVKGLPFKNLDGFYYIDPEGKKWGVDFTIGIAHTLGGRGKPKLGHVFPVRNVSGKK